MRLGVNVPNFGPGTNPDVLRRWALTVEGLGFDLLMMSDHIAVTPDVAQEVPFRERGRLTDEHLLAIRAAWRDAGDYRSGQIPVWIGGNSDAALRRAVRLGDAWHPLRFTPGWLADAAGRLAASAAEQQRPQPALIPRIALRLTSAPITDASRLAGHGTIDQIAEDLDRSRALGADTVVLDPFNGDHQETAHPETAWVALATVAERWHQQKAQDIDAERS